MKLTSETQSLRPTNFTLNLNITGTNPGSHAPEKTGEKNAWSNPQIVCSSSSHCHLMCARVALAPIEGNLRLSDILKLQDAGAHRHQGQLGRNANVRKQRLCRPWAGAYVQACRNETPDEEAETADDTSDENGGKESSEKHSMKRPTKRPTTRPTKNGGKNGGEMAGEAPDATLDETSEVTINKTAVEMSDGASASSARFFTTKSWSRSGVARKPEGSWSLTNRGS